jgi:hypothetical protein
VLVGFTSEFRHALASHLLLRHGGILSTRSSATKIGKIAVAIFVGLLSAIAPLVVAPAAAADPPTQFLDTVTFVDVNPCTGLDHTVTIVFAGSEHRHGERVVAHAKRTITTDPTGFVGRGTDSFVDNGQISKLTFTDILRNPAGDRIRARGVIVVELPTETIRVEKIALTCLGPA